MSLQLESEERIGKAMREVAYAKRAREDAAFAAAVQAQAEVGP